MLMLKIAFRNIFRQRRRTLLTVLTMLGGLVLAAFSFGLSDGTYTHVIDMFTRNQMGHIQIHGDGYLDRPMLYNTIDNIDEIATEIEANEHVVAWSPRLYSSGLASVGEKTAGVRIVGVDLERENNATRFYKKIIDGQSFSTPDAHEVILGIGTAKTLKADLGDTAVIVSQGADGSIANDLYVIVGLTETGDNLVDNVMFYLPLATAQELLVLEGRVHEMVIILDDLEFVLPVTDELNAMLAGTELKAAPWQEFAASFYRAMRADQQGTWIMLFIIIIIVAVGVLNTVLMTVLEGTGEYGVLRVVGIAPGRVFMLVLYEVSFMALISIVVGTAIGVTINYLLSFKGIPIPMEYSYGGVEFDSMLSTISARSIYIPIVTVAVSSLIISVFPALKAARVAPAKAMRTH